MPDLPVPDGTLHYEISGSGPAITFLHGFTQGGRSWNDVGGLLGPGWRVLAPDLRGHGGTRLRPAAPHTMDACLADLEAIWAAEGIEQTHLVGYSLRGMGAAAMEPVWDRLQHVTGPCLFVAGADDHGYAHEARRLAAAVPNGRAEIVPRAGHAVHLERPQALATLLLTHLNAAGPP